MSMTERRPRWDRFVGNFVDHTGRHLTFVEIVVWMVLFNNGGSSTRPPSPSLFTNGGRDMKVPSPSPRQLTEKIGCSQKKVEAAIESLKARGLLEVIHQGNQTGQFMLHWQLPKGS
jgi:hypothetical protein